MIISGRPRDIWTGCGVPAPLRLGGALGGAGGAAAHADEFAAEPIEGGVDGALFHRGARAGEIGFFRPDAAGGIEGEVDGADGVFGRAAAGAAKAGDGEGVVGAEAFGRAGAKAISKKTRFLSIGPVTTKTMRSYGLKPWKQAKTFTLDGIVETLVKKGKL